MFSRRLLPSGFAQNGLFGFTPVIAADARLTARNCGSAGRSFAASLLPCRRHEHSLSSTIMAGCIGLSQVEAPSCCKSSLPLAVGEIIGGENFRSTRVGEFSTGKWRRTSRTGSLTSHCRNSKDYRGFSSMIEYVDLPNDRDLRWDATPAASIGLYQPRSPLQ